MSKLGRTGLAVALAALGFAGSAQAAWHVHTLANSETFLRGVDARPDRVPVVLDERVSGGRNRLELRVGNRAPLTLDEGHHAFDDVRVDHDGRGTLVVAWGRVPDAGGARQLFVWTARGGAVQLTTGSASTNLTSLDVASDGGAVLAAFRHGELLVARRAPGADGFDAPVLPAQDIGLFPAVAAGPGGRAVVAWTQRGTLAAAAADGAGPFGVAQQVAVPLAPDGRTPFVDGVRLAATPTGRVVLATRTIVDHDGSARRSGTRVDLLDWAPGAVAPGAARTISEAAFAGVPALVARAEVVFVAWTETATTNRRPRTIRVVRFGLGGPAPSTTYTASGHDVGSVFGAPPVLQAIPGTAVRAYYRPGLSSRAYTVTFDDAGRSGGAALVAARTGADIQGALTRAGSLLAWTRKLGATNASYRVEVATP
jgi:hypothetical protein